MEEEKEKECVIPEFFQQEIRNTPGHMLLVGAKLDDIAKMFGKKVEIHWKNNQIWLISTDKTHGISYE